MSLVDLGKRLLESAKHGETEEVRLLMTNGAPFTTDWLGTSPLHMAAQYGHVTTAEVLLRAGISRDARTKVDRTPLHIASQEGHLDIVELLIKHGAEVDAKDMLRMTPLHWAVERGHIPVINCLLKHNADVHSVSKFDKTPVDVAEDNGLGDVMDILEDHAASPPKTQDSIQKNKPVHMTKVQKILPKPSAADSPAMKTAIPVTIKTESISVAHIKDIVNRTVATNNHAITSTANSTTYTSTTSAKTMPSQRPVYLHANITHLQKAAASSNTNIKSSSSDSEEGETSEQSCTNVLATLAALAEATAPNATISTSEALQWLEMHGITMLPADNTTVVGTALEGGQTVSLTEAGKLALTWVKEHQTLNNNTTEVSSSVQENVQNNNLSDVSTTPNQKVITIVADQLPSIITNQQSPIVVVSGQTVNATGNNNESSPPVKRLKTYLGRKESPKPTTNGKVTSTSLSAEEERCQLQKELEKIKKQAAQYKAQLLLKEHEAEQYRKQLEQIQTVSRSNQ